VLKEKVAESRFYFGAGRLITLTSWHRHPADDLSKNIGWKPMPHSGDIYLIDPD